MMHNSELKTKLGAIGFSAFFVSAIYFIWSNSGFLSIFTIKHISFILIGTLVSDFIVGRLLYLILKSSNCISDIFPNYSPSSNMLNIVAIFGILTQISIYVCVFFITKYFYISIFTSEYEIKNPPLMRSFHCTQFKNEFTLGKNSNPSNKQIEDLCICIDKKLTETDKFHLNSNIDVIGSDKFISSVSIFGDALKQCGGENL